jgi:ribonuclease P protein component
MNTMPNAPDGERFPPCLRIRSRPQFDAVFSRRLRASDPCMTLYAAPNAEGFARLGVAVSRRTGNAVFRNRIKRRLRDVFRRSRGLLPVGVDYVVVPQPGRDTSVSDLRESFLSLAERLRPRVEAARQSERPADRASADKRR